MRKVIILVLCSMVILLINACSQNVSGDGVIFQKADTLSKDSNLEETINGNLEDGVYGLQTKSKYYIIFNGIENTYSDISYKTNGDSLEILFSKERFTEGNQIIYEVTLPDHISTIKLLQDGENIAFKSIIVAN